MPVTVSRHAMTRYRERVADLPDEAIVSALSGFAFDVLNSMGRGAVILSSGARAIVEDGCVVTVLEPKRRVLSWWSHPRASKIHEA